MRVTKEAIQSLTKQGFLIEFPQPEPTTKEKAAARDRERKAKAEAKKKAARQARAEARAKERAKRQAKSEAARKASAAAIAKRKAKFRATIAEVIQRVKAGESPYDIAAEVERHPATVYTWLREHGEYLYLTKDEVEWLKERRERNE